MGYLSIPLNEPARKLLAIVFPFGYFECLVLPQGVKPAKDIFQVRMVGIFASMHMNRPCPYLDDIFHYKRETFDEYQQILDKIFERLSAAGVHHGDRSRPFGLYTHAYRSQAHAQAN